MNVKKPRLAQRLAGQLGIQEAVQTRDEAVINEALARSDDWRSICELANVKTLPYEDCWLGALADAEKRRRRSVAHLANAEKNFKKWQMYVDAMSIEELKREYDRLLPIIDNGNNERRLQYVRDLLVSKRHGHRFRGWH